MVYRLSNYLWYTAVRSLSLSLSLLACSSPASTPHTCPLRHPTALGTTATVNTHAMSGATAFVCHACTSPLPPNLQITSSPPREVALREQVSPETKLLEHELFKKSIAIILVLENEIVPRETRLNGSSKKEQEWEVEFVR